MRPLEYATPLRADDELVRFNEIDFRLSGLARRIGASERRYPVLIRGDVLARAEYDRAFPHLLLMAGRVANPEGVCLDADTFERQVPTGWCLSPAVCYHVYEQFSGSVLDQPVIVTAAGRCFRNEAWIQPGVRQVEFEMREAVLLGPRWWVQDKLREVARGFVSLVHGLGIAGRWRPAVDPFFLPETGRATFQRLLGVKREYQTKDGLALISVNRHRQFFGERFQIFDRSGEPVHSACIAAGLDRIERAAGLGRNARSALELVK